MGLPPKSSLAFEIAYLVWTLWVATCVDRLHLPSLAFAEHTSRRVLQIQKAARRNAKAPDFESLDPVMRHASDLSGIAYTPDFDKFLAELNKAEAMVLKQGRLAAEEEVHVDTPKDGKKKH